MHEGLFGIHKDYSKRAQSLDERFVLHQESTFFFEIEGDAMAPYILSGDVLIVDRALDWSKNRVILCFYDGQMLCRRLLQDERGHYFLRAENSRYTDIFLDEDWDAQFFGVVRAIGRDIE